jgi:hypothetical protein
MNIVIVKLVTRVEEMTVWSEIVWMAQLWSSVVVVIFTLPSAKILRDPDSIIGRVHFVETHLATTDAFVHERATDLSRISTVRMWFLAMTILA